MRNVRALLTISPVKFWKSSVFPSQKKPNPCFKVRLEANRFSFYSFWSASEPTHDDENIDTPIKPERQEVEAEAQVKQTETEVKVETNGKVKTELKEEMPDSNPDPPRRKRNKFCQCC